MKNKFSRYSFIILLWLSGISNICISQTSSQKIVNFQESIGKQKLIQKFVTIFGDGIYTCIPVYVNSDSYKGYAIIDGEDLLHYYRHEILDSVQQQIMTIEDYYSFATNLLLKMDTICLGSRKLFDYKRGWEFHTFPIIDTIMNYPKDKREKLINLAFEDNGEMRIDNMSNRVIYQPGSLILKLLEWGILVVRGDDPPSYVLFNATIFEESRKLVQPADMINDCLMNFIDYINNPEELYVLIDYYPYNFDFKDTDINKEINYISIEEMRKSENLELLEKGINVVFFEAIKLENDSLIFKFSLTPMIIMNEKQLKKLPPIHSGNYTFQYSPVTRNWSFIGVDYSNEE